MPAHKVLEMPSTDFLLVPTRRSICPSDVKQSRLDGGRTWWAHFELTRIKTTPIILPKRVEDLREAGSSRSVQGEQSSDEEVDLPASSTGLMA